MPQKLSPSVEDAAKDAETRAFAVAMAKIGWETKAEGITVLHVAPLVTPPSPHPCMRERHFSLGCPLKEGCHNGQLHSAN